MKIEQKSISINPIAELIIAIGIVQNSPTLVAIGKIEREKFEQDMADFLYGVGI